ncbi:hypothetical protein E1A91_D09G111000v1 [Gossypium mustelinum]|uniref:Wall-associated receptor kinase C-terminal domain-containing protein n=1 Tax=Gossypium mustelinum TaxID=34275 RepID=A0A5D2TKL6_GOSMU|nr:hypothetical protein E1A91_D09G111000v1 [Gossypium mustelinum]
MEEILQIFKKFKLQYLLLSHMLLFTTSTALKTAPTLHCGNLQLQTPFLAQNSTNFSPLNLMTRCKSQKLYFRTSLGLFPISSIDYTSKTLIVSHTSCSSSEHFVSPALLSAGFPSPPLPNSLLLFNCSHKTHPTAASFIHNCTRFHMCGEAASEVQLPFSCLLVKDIEKLDPGFHPKDLSCSGYRRVYRRSLSEEDYEGVDLGSRISFDIPDHVPDMCNECKKPNGNCGVGLKCICHANDCKDKVLSAATSLDTERVVCFLSSLNAHIHKASLGVLYEMILMKANLTPL